MTPSSPSLCLGLLCGQGRDWISVGQRRVALMTKKTDAFPIWVKHPSTCALLRRISPNPRLPHSTPFNPPHYRSRRGTSVPVVSICTRCTSRCRDNKSELLNCGARGTQTQLHKLLWCSRNSKQASFPPSLNPSRDNPVACVRARRKGKCRRPTV